MVNVEDFFKNLSDNTRLTIVLLIASEQELCVCELTHSLQLSQPKISRHIALLRETGLLTQRRQGKWVYYRLSNMLASWQVNTINSITIELQPTLKKLKVRLNSMGKERPERIKNCCQ